MKNLKENKGITLIALIITIIVMLILVGASVAVAINGGLFNTAREAKTKTQIESDKETLTSAVVGALNDNQEVDKTKLTNYLKGWKVEGETDPFICTSPKDNIYEVSNNGTITRISRPGLKVGDYINYTPDVADAYILSSTNSGYTSNQTITQDTSLKWRVLKIYEDGRIDLISEQPTNETVGFGGATGYNNGVYLLHDICEKLYSNKSLGVTARSINLEDIESQMTEEGKKTRDSFYMNEIQYNTQGTTYPLDCSYYPNLYEKENGSGIDTTIVKRDGISASNKAELDTSSTQYKNANINGLTMTQTYYRLPFTTLNYGAASELFMANNGGWVATRYASYGDGQYGYFGLCFLANEFNGTAMFRTINGEYTRNAFMCPIISLGSNIKITINEGTISEMHEIVK